MAVEASRYFVAALVLIPLAVRLLLRPRTNAPVWLLVTSWVAMQNHCSFCIDIARAAALMERVDLDKRNALPEWRSSPLFDERERAALTFADEANHSLSVSDETFERARKHFSEREVTEIMILGAVEERLRPPQHSPGDRGRQPLRDPAAATRARLTHRGGNPRMRAR